ncbi:hypothetical protein ACFTWS_13730 [Streptomyces sp. NPDC057027]|uniref:hypothetical protein n=1 Tax=Streptomyces sp. NPDC057027 TaxID=3346004 RepID=UPI00363C9950
MVHERPDLPRVPAELRDLLARCLAKCTEDRPTDSGRPRPPRGRRPARVRRRLAAAPYVPGCANVEPTSPDTSYEFDLRAGKVVPEDTAAWYLACGADAFVLSGASDAFIADGDEPTMADRVHGIETQPVTALPFADLAGERPFCVRSTDRKKIVIARLTEAPEDGSVTIALDRHHREGRTGGLVRVRRARRTRKGAG